MQVDYELEKSLNTRECMLEIFELLELDSKISVIIYDLNGKEAFVKIEVTNNDVNGDGEIISVEVEVIEAFVYDDAEQEIINNELSLSFLKSLNATCKTWQNLN